MTKIMTPSDETVISDGQIEKLVDKLRAAARKHRWEVPSKMAQRVLGIENLGMGLFGIVRKYIEGLSHMFGRVVSIDLRHSPKSILEATGFEQYVDNEVVAAMPKGRAKEEVLFLRIGPEANNKEVEETLLLFGLKAASPYLLAKINEDEPDLVNTHPTATHWKDADGNWCYATFELYYGTRRMSVRRTGFNWDDAWWFAGVPRFSK